MYCSVSDERSAEAGQLISGEHGRVHCIVYTRSGCVCARVESVHVYALFIAFHHKEKGHVPLRSNDAALAIPAGGLVCLGFGNWTISHTHMSQSVSTPRGHTLDTRTLCGFLAFTTSVG